MILEQQHIYIQLTLPRHINKVGQIAGANSPVGLAINCDGSAYIVDVVFGIS